MDLMEWSDTLDVESSDSDTNSNYSTVFTKRQFLNACSRSGHVAQRYGNDLVIWGGQFGMPDKLDSCNPGRIWIYNTLTGIMTEKSCPGWAAPKLCGTCALVYDDYLYIFGGFCTSDFLHDSHFSKLFRTSLVSRNLFWEQLDVIGDPPNACDKLAGWVHGDKIYFFGGFGPKFSPAPHSDTEFVGDTSTNGTKGWNNQFFCYNPATGGWEWPRTRGPKPRARAAHSAAISGNTVYLFGGRLNSERNNELHALDMRTMTWSGNLKSLAVSYWPIGRSWHTFTFISPNVAILIGGLTTSGQTLDDIWKMTIGSDKIDCQRYSNYHLSRPYSKAWSVGKLKEVLWHQSVYFPKADEIIIIGGMNTVNRDAVHRSMAVLHFSPKSLWRLCLDFIENEPACVEGVTNTDLPPRLHDLIVQKSSTQLNSASDLEDSTSEIGEDDDDDE